MAVNSSALVSGLNENRWAVLRVLAKKMDSTKNKEHLRDLHHDLSTGVVSGIRKVEPPWMAGFGVLSDLVDENRRVLSAIEEELERD